LVAKKVTENREEMMAKIGGNTRIWMAGLALFASAMLAAGTAQAAKIRIAFGDSPAVESLHLLAAFERAKEMGLDLEVTYLKSEDIAAQAVVGGQADIGVGAPYALIQKVKTPVRMILQLSKLRFYPIVSAADYKSWKDLDGKEIAVHSRGSGTEAIVKLMAAKHGITYSNISYVPGSEVRAGALLQGTIKATIVDAPNRRMLMDKAPGKFTVLPLDDVSATDEAFFANEAFLQKNAADVEKLIEAVLITWREVAANPASVADLRAKYKLMQDMPPEMQREILPYFQEAAEAKVLTLNGGGEVAVKDDFAFFTLSGQLQGEAATLKPSDFWNLKPLEKVLAKIGTK
jgi:NitT/TauT family transport system substrate-binding protein